MEICNHFIQRDQIIGIGPLMAKQSSDITIRQVYNSRQLFFYLHLKNHSVIIESDWIDLEPIMDNHGKNKIQYEAFRKTYNEVAEEIKVLIENADNINTQQ